MKDGVEGTLLGNLRTPESNVLITSGTSPVISMNPDYDGISTRANMKGRHCS